MLLAPVYWITGVLRSMGAGPEDDITIIQILAIPILLHGLITAKYGFSRASRYALVYFSLIAALCIARCIEILGSSGYDHWHAMRSLKSLAWTLPWFSVGLIVSLFYKPVELASAGRFSYLNDSDTQ